MATRTNSMSRAGVTQHVVGVIALACSLLLQSCGGVTVMPTAPTPVMDRVTQGSPTILRFRGTLEDGGSFKGYILYGSRDIDSRPEFGRYQGAYWDAVVTGGSSTRDYHFNDSLGGRALLETYNTPTPTIGLVFLWPREDPSIQALTPHFHSDPSYHPDEPPTIGDFGRLLPGVASEIPQEAGAVSRSRYTFGVFRDGLGGEVLVRSLQFDSPVAVPDARVQPN